MKKNGYCKDCDYQFSYNINNSYDLNNVYCPKCNSKINPNYKKVVPLSKFERKVDKAAHNVLNFYYYFYFIFSILGLLCYYFDFNKLVFVFSFICFFTYFIELFIGFTRNLFGVFGLFISSVIGIVILKDVRLGICIGSFYLFLISGIIKIIFNLIINKLYRKYG